MASFRNRSTSLSDLHASINATGRNTDGLSGMFHRTGGKGDHNGRGIHLTATGATSASPAYPVQQSGSAVHEVRSVAQDVCYGFPQEVWRFLATNFRRKKW